MIFFTFAQSFIIFLLLRLTHGSQKNMRGQLSNKSKLSAFIECATNICLLFFIQLVLFKIKKIV